MNILRSVSTVIFLSIAVTCHFGIARCDESQPDVGDVRSPDPHVASMLRESGLRFSMSEEGDYRLSFKLPDARMHSVFVSSKIIVQGAIRFRKVYAFAQIAKTRLSSKKLESLLFDNANQPAGGWSLVSNDKGEAILIFSVKVDPECGADVLKDVIHAVAVNADAMEEELTSKDMY